MSELSWSNEARRLLGLAAIDLSGAVDREQAISAWRIARGQVIATLKQLEKAVRSMRDPESDAAIILLRAIQANLTESPDSLQKVSELERYIVTDDIIRDAESPNGFGIDVSIQSQLMPAIRALKSAYASGASGGQP